MLIYFNIIGNTIVIPYLCVVKLQLNIETMKQTAETASIRSRRWYLRGGDFRPEEATDENLRLLFGRHSSVNLALEQLEADNNLFSSEQEAMQASVAIRCFLASFRIVSQEHRRSALRTQKRFRSSAPLEDPAPSRIPDMEIQSYCGEPQEPTAESGPYPGDNSHCHAKGTRLTIHFQS